jgi:hypothetical protein
VQFTTNTTSVSVSNFDAEDREPEVIPLTATIEHRLLLSEFPDSHLQLNPISVRHVFPCQSCGAPVVLARLGRVTKLLDAWENEFSPCWWARWETDPALCTHHCSGCLQ